MRFSVKNQTGETWPAYGIARLGTVLSYDGPNADVPLYDLIKPDGEDGIYVVNGAASLETAKEGTAVHCSVAEYVFVDTLTVTVGDKLGAESGKWNATSAGTISLFKCTDVKNSTTNVAPVIVTGSGTSSSSDSCPCVCLSSGDIIVNGVQTTSLWTIKLGSEIFQQTYGAIYFPSGTYTVAYNSTLGYWTLDIGDYLTAKYLSGADATSATTMDGTLSMIWDGYSNPQIRLCVDGTVPAP